MLPNPNRQGQPIGLPPGVHLRHRANTNRSGFAFDQPNCQTAVQAMNGPLAQFVALTCHANAFLRGWRVPHFLPGNEPAFLPYVLRAVAECLARPVEEVAEATTKVATGFFQLGN
jgi:hypothetical protein